MTALKLLYNFIFKTKRRSLEIKTIFLTAHASFCIKLYPGSRIHNLLGKKGEESSHQELERYEDRQNIYFVSDKLARVSRRVPWDCKCLVQAMTAQRLLRDYGLSSTLYLGVGRDNKTGEMIAHAWVRCGTHAVCGGNGEDYGVVASFLM